MGDEEEMTIIRGFESDLATSSLVELVNAISSGKIFLDPCASIDNNTGAEFFYSVDNPAPAPEEWRFCEEGLVFVHPPHITTDEWINASLKYKSIRKPSQLIFVLRVPNRRHEDSTQFSLLISSCDFHCRLYRQKFGQKEMIYFTKNNSESEIQRVKHLARQSAAVSRNCWSY